MSGEHPLVAVWTPDVPQLNISIFKGSSKGEILHAELYVSYTLGLAWKKSNGKKKYWRETFSPSRSMVTLATHSNFPTVVFAHLKMC